MGLTQEVASYVAKTRYRDIPSEVIRAARGFVLDGLGVALAGATEKSARIVLNHVRQMGGKAESTVVGTGLKVPAPKAALINGVAGHAMDYDDTQLSTSKEAVYGLLTHPTTPVLNAVLAVGEKEKINGEAFLLAYIVGVEVECRIADAINPRHYQSGFHSTATIGGLGASMAVGKILGLKEEALIRTLGYRGEHGLRPARKLRHDDEAVACRARSRERRYCGAAGAGGIYVGDEYSGGAAGILPRHGRGLRREQDLRQAWGDPTLCWSRAFRSNLIHPDLYLIRRRT